MTTPGFSPIRQILLKVHSRCNLACDHCYVYEGADQSWRSQPMTMSPAVAALAARRIAEHMRRHDLPWATVILHGGEPLLAGRDRLGEIVAAVRSAVPPGRTVDVSVQTNGLLLDDAYLDFFARQGIRVGVSLDGGEQANDRHRRYAHGGGSYRAVAQALALLSGRPDVYSGLLATVDLRNDPVEVYEELLRFRPPRIDFLLPHGNWTTPPPGRPAEQSQTPYGDWLVAVFDRWYGAGAPETRVRLFDSLVSLLLGGPTGSESVGLASIDLLTIETDGSIEQGDVLKTAGPGMAATGLHVADHSFDDALAHPALAARQAGLAALADECRQCPLVRVCGGGHYAHRYRAGSGFRHPSVFCADLARLIGHVRGRLYSDLRVGAAL
ncbi:FxsB family cyclophane-forming radical SAM/SPASM peptide maturase [Hamadaea tsunoensis]|uniref:FxsB family cyclophane-forming radical SAM/SPASM peptide maturase n=1 Tax=Hamadaea tsunoensis TaxID=53368 RepID=UPI0005597B90|nr:FxsB family cyclophane-forming radical SAM/SPASM peptide maturase [Hamadaea tsunoensis]